MTKNKADLIRERAEADLEFFIRLVHKQRVLGSIHSELCQWWTREDAKSHQLVLLPRDHGKSAMIAYRVAWEITRNPTVRVLYVSATSTLAVKQLKFIKDILTSKTYRQYWPEMVNLEETKREKWTETEIAVDHPLRKAEAIRDPTVFTAGLNTTITGLHFDVIVLDDLVVRENAYTEEGRTKVQETYSLLASIASGDAREWVVGTRYHPKDLYNDMVSIEYEKYDDETGELIGSEPLYEKFERQVEDVGDGTGQFLWPRQRRYDGKWFGFDQGVLAKKRAQYLDKTQFRAQYYNDPNDTESAGISPELFQYYNQALIKETYGVWHYGRERLNVFAAIDFAYSFSKRADYTSIVVVGVDRHRNYYVLDIDRFKTTKIKDYFDHLLRLHEKWNFRKLRAEVTAAQRVIVEDLKENYIKKNGLILTVEDFTPTRHSGTKEDRINATLVPKYQNRQIFHYKGGNCQILEEELVLAHPPHDDVKDCLASCIGTAIPPSRSAQSIGRGLQAIDYAHSRFGGVA